MYKIEFIQIVDTLPQFTHLTTVLIALTLSNFLEPHLLQIGQARTFSTKLIQITVI